MAKSAPILIRLGQKAKSELFPWLKVSGGEVGQSVAGCGPTLTDCFQVALLARQMEWQCSAVPVPIAHRKPKPNQNPTEPDPTNFASHILPYPAPLLPSLSRLSRWCHYFEASEKWGLFFIPHRQGYKGSTKYGFRSSWWRTCNWSRAVAVGYRTSRGVLTVLGANITGFWSMIVLGLRL